MRSYAKDHALDAPTTRTGDCCSFELETDAPSIPTRGQPTTPLLTREPSTRHTSCPDRAHHRPNQIWLAQTAIARSSGEPPRRHRITTSSARPPPPLTNVHRSAASRGLIHLQRIYIFYCFILLYYQSCMLYMQFYIILGN